MAGVTHCVRKNPKKGGGSHSRGAQGEQWHAAPAVTCSDPQLEQLVAGSGDERSVAE